MRNTFTATLSFFSNLVLGGSAVGEKPLKHRPILKWFHCAVVGLLFCLPATSAFSSERPLTAEKDGLQAFIASPAQCVPLMKVTVRAASREAFDGDKIGVQHVLGAVRTALEFECGGVVTEIMLDGSVNNSVIYQGFARARSDWVLQDIRNDSVPPPPVVQPVPSVESSTQQEVPLVIAGAASPQQDNALIQPANTEPLSGQNVMPEIDPWPHILTLTPTVTPSDDGEIRDNILHINAYGLINRMQGGDLIQVNRLYDEAFPGQKEAVLAKFGSRKEVTREEVYEYVREQFDKQAVALLGSLDKVSAGLLDGRFSPYEKDLSLVFKSFGRPDVLTDARVRGAIAMLEESGKYPPPGTEPGTEEYINYYEPWLGDFAYWRAGRPGTTDQNTWNGRYGGISNDLLMLNYMRFRYMEMEGIFGKYLNENVIGPGGRLNDNLKYDDFVQMITPDQRARLDQEIEGMKDNHPSSYMQITMLDRDEYRERRVNIYLPSLDPQKIMERKIRSAVYFLQEMVIASKIDGITRPTGTLDDPTRNAITTLIASLQTSYEWKTISGYYSEGFSRYLQSKGEGNVDLQNTVLALDFLFKNDLLEKEPVEAATTDTDIYGSDLKNSDSGLENSSQRRGSLKDAVFISLLQGIFDEFGDELWCWQVDSDNPDCRSEMRERIQANDRDYLAVALIFTFIGSCFSVGGAALLAIYLAGHSNGTPWQAAKNAFWIEIFEALIVLFGIYLTEGAVQVRGVLIMQAAVGVSVGWGAYQYQRSRIRRK